MKKYSKLITIGASVGLLVAVAVGYQNCGPMNGGAFIIGTASSSTTGTIHNTVQATNKLAGGANHTCSLYSGNIYCWGLGTSGQLGYGEDTSSLGATEVIGLGGTPVKVVAGDSFTCALLNNGILQCWGDNSSGELGNNNPAMLSSPTPVTALIAGGVYDVAAAFQTTCAVMQDGTVQCFGLNTDGELGVGLTPPLTYTPIIIPGLTDIVKISGSFKHFCATHITGAVSCWGEGNEGELGNNGGGSSTVPVGVVGLSTTVSKIASGQLNSCALLTNGQVQCWGDNTYGQLGNGNANPTVSVVTVSGLSGITDIAVGTYFACATLANATVQCWGADGGGELGNNVSENYSYTPSTVYQLTSAVGIGTGYNHACAYISSNTISCWGENPDGQLGCGSACGTGNQIKPIAVTGL